MQHPNLTLRDYLIAHAPAKPQAWFVPKMPPKPPNLTPQQFCASIGDAAVREDARTAIVTDSDAATPAGQQWVRAWLDARDAARQWFSDYDVQCYLQWPGAWADTQIALRPADERAYLFALTVADADGAHAYAISKVGGSQTEARAAAIAAAIADRGGFGVEPLECALVQRIHVLDGDVFIRMGVLA